jgi:hypothetical protein
MQSSESQPMFQRNMSPPSSVQRGGNYDSAKCQLTFTRLHDVISQKRELFIAVALKISNQKQLGLQDQDTVSAFSHEALERSERF